MQTIAGQVKNAASTPGLSSNRQMHTLEIFWRQPTDDGRKALNFNALRAFRGMKGRFL
jgi:hypothetical protein